MNNKLLTISKLPLPDDMINEINSYLFITSIDNHKHKMRKILDEIECNDNYCDTCGKYLVRYIYCIRNGEEMCCSPECVDNYPGLFQTYKYLHRHHL